MMSYFISVSSPLSDEEVIACEESASLLQRCVVFCCQVHVYMLIKIAIIYIFLVCFQWATNISRYFKLYRQFVANLNTSAVENCLTK